MTTYWSPRLLSYAVISSVAVVLGIATGRAEPIVIGAPFLLLLALAAFADRTAPELALQVTVDRAKVLEGDELALVVDVGTIHGRYAVAFRMDVPVGLELVDRPTVQWVTARSSASIRARIRCRRWGAYTIGGGRLVARDQLSAFVHERAIEPKLEIRVYPRPERLRSFLQPNQLRPRFGSLVSKAAGIGLEFADIREFTPGDQRRHINWKASARRGRTHVNLFHPERSGDVVLLLDTMTDVVSPRLSSLDLAVNSAASVALACLKRRDRVGLLAVGGTFQWLLPGMGLRQFYRIVDSLMQTQLGFSYAWPSAEAIPRQAIPPGALVVALTSLADRRMPAILINLVARGHDVAVIEIHAAAILAEPVSDREKLAHRLWVLHRETMRHYYRGIGLAVSVWEPQRSLRVPIVELERFRRRRRRTRV